MAEPVRVLRSSVLRAARKKLPFASNGHTRQVLDAMGADLVEAYRIGAEEAQATIVARLTEVEPTHG